MFGTQIVNASLVPVFEAVPDLVAAVNDRFISKTYVPDGIPLPALLFYAEATSYVAAIGSSRPNGPVNFEAVQLTVRLICDGNSTEPIYEAAEAYFEALRDLRINVQYRGWNYMLTFNPVGEVAMSAITEGPNDYSQLGTDYSVEIIRGGAVAP